ncbi:hypothetical protein ISP17_12825 [Dyella ginsengisoli]|uniref:N-acetyltransferase domain-containing protein n=1 Tax=Dyella ginsengisoli TaxID=363848 RepID=A0ABW8JX81_9GAMM
MITFDTVRPEVIPGLALRLSQADLVELERRGWRSPADAIREAVAASSEAFTASWDGEVRAVFGVAEWRGETPEGMGRVGMPWMLCAAPPPHVQMTFMRMAEEVMERWSRTFRTLIACVDAEHTRARRWLVSLGLHPVNEQQHNGFPVIGFMRHNPQGDSANV